MTSASVCPTRNASARVCPKTEERLLNACARFSSGSSETRSGCFWTGKGTFNPLRACAMFLSFAIASLSCFKYALLLTVLIYYNQTFLHHGFGFTRTTDDLDLFLQHDRGKVANLLFLCEHCLRRLHRGHTLSLTHPLDLLHY